MLRLAALLLAVALTAAFCGFEDLAGHSSDGTKVIAVICFTLAVMCLLGSRTGGATRDEQQPE